MLAAAGAVAALLWWRGPAWGACPTRSRSSSWRWVVAAIALNLLSVVARSIAWRTVIDQACRRRIPSFMLVFAAFSVGLFANAVLPGRIGELARVAVLNRRMPQRGLWATLVGTVFAHRVFDLVPVLMLIVYVASRRRSRTGPPRASSRFVAVGHRPLRVRVRDARSTRTTLALDGLGAVRRSDGWRATGSA